MFSGVQAWITQYALLILGGVIVLLLIFGAAQTVRLKVAVAEKNTAIAEKGIVEAQLQTQLNAMQQLARQGEELTARVKYNQQKASEANAKFMKALEDIQVEIVPAECEEAAKWAAGKASSLSAGW